MPTFQAIVTALGLLLIIGALPSGLARRSFLSLTALFVLAGFALGPGGFGWIDFRAHSGFVEDLAFAALIVILFRDGLEVDGEMLQREWRLPGASSCWRCRSPRSSPPPPHMRVIGFPGPSPS